MTLGIGHVFVHISQTKRKTKVLSGKVLITGGSGFLGRAIIRRAQNEKWPCDITVYSRDETKQDELKHKYPAVTCILGDVSRDLDRLIAVMHGFDTVIHAAAVKYIDAAEYNIFETIDVNIKGSQNVAIAARAAGVETVVGISTDKACQPANIYGLTKGVMEKIFVEANKNTKTRFVTCRYGNVVGSTGSVIPKFRQQLKELGSFSVTDSKMTRFWIGVDQAIDLILWSVNSAEEYPGRVFIPFCPGMRTVDVAKCVFYESGTKGDPKISYTGIRPGEKLHESLFSPQEAPRVWQCNPNGFIMDPATVPAHSPDMMEYTSDHAKPLDVEDMLKFMKDSALV